MKTVEQNKSGSPVGASKLWWKRFVEQVSFEPGIYLFQQCSVHSATIYDTV